MIFVDDWVGFDWIQCCVVEFVVDFLCLFFFNDLQDLFDIIYICVGVVEFNVMWMYVIMGFNVELWLCFIYFCLVCLMIEIIVGNEFCMQCCINFSVQFLGDDFFLFVIYLDVWLGDFLFEVVVWVLLVDVKRIKVMYLLLFLLNGEMQDCMVSLCSVEDVY